jgi:hypothetical protein
MEIRRHQASGKPGLACDVAILRRKGGLNRTESHEVVSTECQQRLTGFRPVDEMLIARKPLKIFWREGVNAECG